MGSYIAPLSHSVTLTRAKRGNAGSNLATEIRRFKGEQQAGAEVDEADKEFWEQDFFKDDEGEGEDDEFSEGGEKRISISATTPARSERRGWVGGVKRRSAASTLANTLCGVANTVRSLAELSDRDKVDKFDSDFDETEDEDEGGEDESEEEDDGGKRKNVYKDPNGTRKKVR